MVLDKNVIIKIGGKDYKLCYPMKSVFGAERDLSGNNLLLLIAQGRNGIPANLSDMYVLFKWGFVGANPEYEKREDDVEALYYQAIEENGILGVFTSGLEAVRKSGILGDTKKAPAAPRA